MGLILLYVVNSPKGGTKLSNFVLDIKCEVPTIVSCFKVRLFVAMIKKEEVLSILFLISSYSKALEYN